MSDSVRTFAGLLRALDRCRGELSIAGVMAARLYEAEPAPLTLDGETDRQIADAARRYISGWHSIEHADAGGYLEALRETDAALHDLAVLVDGECLTCETGSCPRSISTVDVRSGAL